MIGKLRLLCGMLLVAALALAIAGAVVGDSSDQVTEIAIDGDSADWSTMGTTSWDRRGDGRGGIDILSVRAFTSDAYLFVLIELAPGIGDYSFVSLAINPSGDEEAPFYANANPREKTTLDLHRFANGEFTPIGEHGEAAEGEDAIEILVPLAVLGTVVERFEVEIVAGSSPNIFLADGAIVAYLAHVEGVESGEHTAAAPEITSSASDDASPEVAGEPSSALAEIYDCGQAVATDLSATEGELTWARLGGPPAGLGYDIRMDPQNPDKMYVTDAFAGLHISTDGGRSWVPSNEGIDARTGGSGDIIPIFSATVDPHNPDIVWVGTQNVLGIYKTTDGGATWAKKVNGVVETEGISFRGFTVDPRDSDIVYAAAELSIWAWKPDWEPEQGMNQTTKGVVYRTMDGGESWTAIWRGDNLARYVWIDPRDPNTLYVSTGIFDRDAANANPATGDKGGVGIAKSTDGGRTWRTLDESNGLVNLYVGSLYMHPENPDILLAGTGGAGTEDAGVYLTKDGGESWRRVLRLGFVACSSVEFAESDPDIAYAASEHGFFRSEDGGESWEQTHSGRTWGPEGVHAGVTIDLQVDPRDPDRIFANNYGGGNFLSEDGGKTWVDASNGYTGAQVLDVAVHPDNPDIVYANGKCRPFMSVDGGVTWHGISPKTPEINVGARIAVDPHDSCHILATDSEGSILESVDGGVTMTAVMYIGRELEALNLPDPSNQFQGVQAIAFSPTSEGKVYAGFGIHKCANGSQLWRCEVPTYLSLLLSDDAGHTWEQVSGTALDGKTVTGIAVHPSNGERAWAVTGDGGIFTTSDGGRTWLASSRGFPARTILCITASDDTSPILYMGTAGGGIYRSLNLGDSWSSASAGMDPNETVDCVAVDPSRHGVIFAGTERSGVYVSFDAGDSWKSLNYGLLNRSVNDLAVSSEGEFLYAATDGGGVFRLPLANLSEDAVSTPSSGGSGDRDGDGVPDAEDFCPDFPGDALMGGC